MYGPDRLVADLRAKGLEVERVTGADGVYVVIRHFTVPLGRFAGHVIDLGLFAMPDYPRNVASAIHVRAEPQLLDTHDCIPGVRNIIASALGPDWRYWSYNLGWNGSERSTRRYLSQINRIFEDA